MRRRSSLARSLALTASSVVSLFALSARADTVAAEAAKGACSTGGVVGLSDQLVKEQMCLSPGTFVEFAPHAGVTLTSSNVKPYLLATARDALWAAAGSLTLDVNSAFRTLADQYVLYYSGGCGLAAKPGNSNHETGKAVDLENWSAATSAMVAAGCTHTYPSSDPVHFDCPGADHRADSILAFQRLWNLNNPGDKIAEDGSYGPETESRLAKSPAGGFPVGDDCTAPPPTPDWAGQFVDQSFPMAGAGGVLTMTVGEDVTGFIEMKNVGGKAWDGKTFLGTTMPRDRSSAVVGKDWTAPNRPVGVGGVVSPGGTHKFQFSFHASAVGEYDEHFGMVEEGVAWFSDKGQGGPADDLLEVKIKVVSGDTGADAGDAGHSDAAHDGGGDVGDEEGLGDEEGAGADAGAGAGCACRAAGGGAGAGAGAGAGLGLGLGLIGLTLGRRRRARWSRGRP
jgi:hypothetical protein